MQISKKRSWECGNNQKLSPIKLTDPSAPPGQRDLSATVYITGTAGNYKATSCYGSTSALDSNNSCTILPPSQSQCLAGTGWGKPQRKCVTCPGDQILDQNQNKCVPSTITNQTKGPITSMLFYHNDQQINCGTAAPLGGPLPALIDSGKSFTYKCDNQKLPMHGGPGDLVKAFFNTKDAHNNDVRRGFQFIPGNDLITITDSDVFTLNYSSGATTSAKIDPSGVERAINRSSLCQAPVDVFQWDKQKYKAVSGTWSNGVCSCPIGTKFVDDKCMPYPDCCRIMSNGSQSGRDRSDCSQGGSDVCIGDCRTSNSECELAYSRCSKEHNGYPFDCPAYYLSDEEHKSQTLTVLLPGV